VMAALCDNGVRVEDTALCLAQPLQENAGAARQSYFERVARAGAFDGRDLAQAPCLRSEAVRSEDPAQVSRGSTDASFAEDSFASRRKSVVRFSAVRPEEVAHGEADVSFAEDSFASRRKSVVRFSSARPEEVAQGELDVSVAGESFATRRKSVVRFSAARPEEVQQPRNSAASAGAARSEAPRKSVVRFSEAPDSVASAASPPPPPPVLVSELRAPVDPGELPGAKVRKVQGGSGERVAPGAVWKSYEEGLACGAVKPIPVPRTRSLSREPDRKLRTRSLSREPDRKRRRC